MAGTSVCDIGFVILYLYDGVQYCDIDDVPVG